MVFRILLSVIRLPQLLTHKDEVFTYLIFNKGLIIDEILWVYEIQVTYMKIINKFHNLLLLMNKPKPKPGIISDLNNFSFTSKAFNIGEPGNINS